VVILNDANEPWMRPYSPPGIHRGSPLINAEVCP
jgi:hypothetical protein